MTDSDDNLARRYRELSREEPRAALDEAILAASRRAVAKPSWSRRWAAPVSIAAVLVLAFGVTLEMQREEPGIESAPPLHRQVPVPAPSAPASPPADEAPTAAMRDAYVALPKAKSEARQRKSIAAPAMRGLPPESPGANAVSPSLAKEDGAVAEKPAPFPAASAPETMNVSPMSAAAPASAAARAPATAVQSSAPPPSTASAAARAPAAVQSSAPPPSTTGALATPSESAAPSAPQQSARMAPRLKAEAADAVQPAKPAQSAIERELERIAKLRDEGRNAEADKALEQFRRDHPDYPIAKATWQRVKPR